MESDGCKISIKRRCFRKNVDSNGKLVETAKNLSFRIVAPLGNSLFSSYGVLLDAPDADI